MRLHGVLTMTLLSILATVALGQSAPTASPREAFVTANGVRLHYVDWGGTGETLLFLTPLGGELLEQFEALAPRFTDRFRVLGLTRRGQAPSEVPASGYDVDTLWPISSGSSTPWASGASTSRAIRWRAPK